MAGCRCGVGCLFVQWKKCPCGQAPAGLKSGKCSSDKIKPVDIETSAMMAKCFQIRSCDIFIIAAAVLNTTIILRQNRIINVRCLLQVRIFHDSKPKPAVGIPTSEVSHSGGYSWPSYVFQKPDSGCTPAYTGPVYEAPDPC